MMSWTDIIESPFNKVDKYSLAEIVVRLIKTLRDMIKEGDTTVIKFVDKQNMRHYLMIPLGLSSRIRSGYIVGGILNISKNNIYVDLFIILKNNERVSISAAVECDDSICHIEYNNEITDIVYEYDIKQEDWELLVKKYFGDR